MSHHHLNRRARRAIAKQPDLLADPPPPKPHMDADAFDRDAFFHITLYGRMLAHDHSVVMCTQSHESIAYVCMSFVTAALQLAIDNGASEAVTRANVQRLVDSFFKSEAAKAKPTNGSASSDAEEAG